VYRTPGKLCGEQPAEKIIYGIKGCENCLRDALSQLIATDKRFAKFVRDCLLNAYPVAGELVGLDREEVMLELLKDCQKALATCYEVECYPADGSSYHDMVLGKLESFLKTETPANGNS
jgi:hypothetical protein